MTGDRLDKGFVNWQGRRVFVPLWGAPRIVPTADDEVRLVKFKFRMHLVMAGIVIVPFLLAITVRAFADDLQGSATAAPGNADTVAYAVIALVACLVFGVGATAERRYYLPWPLLDTNSFARTRFLWAYFRSLSVRKRIIELGWSGLAQFFLVSMLLQAVRPIESFGESSWLLQSAVASCGIGVFGLLVLRHAAIIVASFFPTRHALAA